MSERSKLDFQIFKKLTSYVKPYRKLLIASFACMLVLSILSPARPALVGKMVDWYIIGTHDKGKLLMWTLILLGILVVEGIFQFLSTYVSSLFAQNIIRDMRKKLFDHILYFRMKYFDQTPIGSLVTRIVSDIEAISEVFSSGLIDIIGDLIMLVVVVTVMFYTNWELTLMTLIPIPLLLFATKVFAKAMRKSFQLERVQVNKMNTFVQERVTGMSIVQLFNRQEKEEKEFQQINKGLRKAHVSAVWAFSIFFPVVEFLSSLSISFLLVWGALQFTGDSQPEGNKIYAEIISFTFWINMLFRPIRQIADKFNILQRGIVRAERVFELLETNEDVQDLGTITNINFNNDIRFKDVHFAYKEGTWILQNLNLTIEKGKTIAFVGATGAGKSTIVNLLGRFYEYQQGDIFLGETNLKDIELNYLRKNISIVLQDVFLFSGTVYENITLGDSSVSLEQVQEAAKAVGAHDFIMRLPGNYFYEVGERGGVLSVGQRQLLAFIRAYVYNPHILVLDEATSSLDDESERMIQAATETLTVGRTSIVIAHRLSTIQKANKIVVLEKGEIVEMGSHEELLAKKGYYKKLYDMQFAEK